LSSGIFPSFENASQQYGYFTDALVKALRNMAYSDRSPESLTKFIQRELQKNGLALPEMYNIGTHAIDIFSPNHNQLDIKKTMNRALAAVFSCGMVMDETLFCKVFNLPESSMRELEHLGLIFFEKGAWHPHDTLNRIVEREKIQIEPEATKSYWFQQFQELPDHFDAALHFVMTIQCFGYEPKCDVALQSAYSILSKAQELDILKESIAIYPKGTQAKSARFLAELFIGLQQFDLAKALLDSGQTCAASCHLLWRTARFSDCIQEATKLISSSDILQAKIPYYWHRGTAHYLAGDWNQALSDFGFIERHSNHPVYVGRSLCILGTLTGIRGINLEESQARIETGIRMLIKNGDQSAAWVGWNNLGEMMWKAGNWKLSQHYLNKSLDCAQDLDNHNMILETLRNFLQLEMRNPHGTRSAIQALVEQIEQILTKPIEIFESMQIYNSLCTAHLALATPPRAQFYLNKAIPLTVLSKEFHIYTLSNLAAMCQKYRLKEKADGFFNRALSLAKEGNNLFAVQQIQNDRA
ncbi:MAG: hypothetical protein LLG04_01995, partial [Parachlamydia sp.]|nr:hypothetical protein [Parachlamydia sp.]